MNKISKGEAGTNQTYQNINALVSPKGRYASINAVIPEHSNEFNDSLSYQSSESDLESIGDVSSDGGGEYNDVPVIIDAA